ncbi:meckelin isoform X1 [Bombus fervidus]|uniref:meckelin isoform X1 n=1 Tax=Bombus fervidus TaxID=203811 RepID=UPI003AB533E6
MCRFTRKNIFFYFLIYSVNFTQIVAVSKELFEYSQPSKCKNNEYFDTISLTCMPCDANKNLKPSVDRLRCICNKFSKKIGFKDGYPVCMFCGINATVTSDGNDCVSCNTTCRCAPNEIQVDRHLNGTLLDTIHCVPCINNTYPFLGVSKCLPCKSFEYDYYQTDMYLTKYHYTQVQNYCLHKSTSVDKENPKSAFQVKFNSQNTNNYFRNELQTAVYFCKKRDKLACEYLSNICVLSLYANDIACKFFMQKQKSPIWLFYNKDEATTVLNSKQITQNYSFMKGDKDNILNFTVITFSLHGNFKSIGTPNIPCNLLEHVKFGINFEKKCKFAIKNLLHTEMEFLSPYLTFIRDNKILMYALPVFVKNINQNHNKLSDWQLVRKFFFVDNISGFKTLYNLTSNNGDELSVLRYMKSLNVIINIQSTKDNNKILPPLLIIEYAELTYEQIDKIIEVTLDYKIRFTLKDDNIDSHFMIIIGILSGLSFILSGIKTWKYSKQHHTSSINVFVLIWFFIYTMSAIGSIIILCLIILCLYLFMFYKGKTIPYILFSEDVNEKMIKTFSTVAFFSKLIEIFGFICQYWNIDIFFIDWEQPKTIYNQCNDLPYVPINEFHNDKLSRNKLKHLQMSSETITAKRKKILYKLNKDNNFKTFNKSFPVNKHKTNISITNSIAKSSDQIIHKSSNFNNSSISIWRTYFIASQWLNLQTERKINIKIQLLVVLCIFQVIRLYPWILGIPELIPTFSEDCNFILYFTICVLIYILTYSIQWLVFIVFYEQCIANKMQEFINVCSIANISVFILPFNYYGFYIHGRSVHGFADTDLRTLINDLQMEKNNLCAHRGLVPGTTQQTFILYLTKTFRITFNKSLELMNIEPSNFIRTYYSNWEYIFNNQLKVKEYLCKYLDHCITNEDYAIKEQHFFEKLFNIVFSHNEEKSVFYIDNNYSFSQVLLYGNEWLFATFEISVFTFIIVLYKDCTLAIIITVLVSMLLVVIVKKNGKKNLNNHTLLDKLFFM